MKNIQTVYVLDMYSMHSLCCFLIKRKKQSQSKNERNRTPCQLDDIPRGSVDTTISSISPVYQNVADIGEHHQGNLRCNLSIQLEQGHPFSHYNSERIIVLVIFKNHTQDILNHIQCKIV